MGEEISRQVLARGKFLALENIRWRDAHGREGDWESSTRNAGRPAALLIAWLQPSDRLVLVRQYRPPARGEVIEFPAGILDEGETPEQAALRELREETGYTGTALRIFPAAYNTPGMSDERVHIVCAEIDESLPENLAPSASHEFGEEISVVLVPRKDLPHFLARETAAGTQFDSKVLACIATIV